jgi:histidinol dehydrogenase
MTINKVSCSNHSDLEDLLAWLQRRNTVDPSLEAKVRDIIQSVSESGDKALVDYTSRFDCRGFSADMIPVSRERISGAADAVEARDRDAICRAMENIYAFHRQQRRTSWFDSGRDGLITGQIHRPIPSAGLYIPGGSSGETPLVSSLLMNAIPAQVAGVERICLVTPPGADGGINPYTLAAADLLGLHEMYAVGGPWAVAGLALGTESLPRVDCIAGPGNIYVTLAKKLVSDRAGIDLLAGPSEIAIIADETADPDLVAADLLSQAEHDERACSLLISESTELLARVETALEKHLRSLPRAETAKASLRDWGGLVSVPDTASAFSLINRMAPEHLELCLQDPWSWLDSVHNAGAVFLGHSTPEALGDYFAGPNHVLPTSGTARFASGLSVDSFCKRTSFIAASRGYMEQHAEIVGRLARLEGLEAHARSALLRTGSKDTGN